MKQLLSVIFSLFLALPVLAQEADSVATDTLTAVEQEISSSKPLSASIYVDYGKLLTVWTDFETKFEGGISLLFFEHIDLNLEYGYGKLKPNDAYLNGTYSATGNYIRLGASYLFVVDPKNQIAFGGKYGLSSFEDSGSINIQGSSGLTEPYYREYSRNSLNANWWELIIASDTKLVLNRKNLESKMNDLIRAGVQFRYRILQDYDKQNPPDIYTIPGYGKPVNRRFPAINLYVKIKLL
jgi:hypothetical protein